MGILIGSKVMTQMQNKAKRKKIVKNRKYFTLMKRVFFTKIEKKGKGSIRILCHTVVCRIVRRLLSQVHTKKFRLQRLVHRFNNRWR